MLLTSPKKNLIILRAGDNSLHKNWVSGGTKDFDLFISYYGTQENLHKEDAQYYEMRRGPKWPCIGELIEKYNDVIKHYDAVWLPDDDIATDTRTINRMFSLFHGMELELAQPALTTDSYYSWDQLLQCPDSLIRYVSFVEVMVPIFSKNTLNICQKTFKESQIGWGIDWIWPTLINNESKNKIAIIDATPVKHTRPVGGELYKNNPEMCPHREQEKILQFYGLEKNRYLGKYDLHSVICKGSPKASKKWNLWLRSLNAKRRLKRKTRKAS